METFKAKGAFLYGKNSTYLDLSAGFTHPLGVRHPKVLESQRRLAGTAELKSQIEPEKLTGLLRQILPASWSETLKNFYCLHSWDIESTLRHLSLAWGSPAVCDPLFNSLSSRLSFAPAEKTISSLFSFAEKNSFHAGFYSDWTHLIWTDKAAPDMFVTFMFGSLLIASAAALDIPCYDFSLEASEALRLKDQLSSRAVVRERAKITDLMQKFIEGCTAENISASGSGLFWKLSSGQKLETIGSRHFGKSYSAYSSGENIYLGLTPIHPFHHLSPRLKELKNTLLQK